MDSHNSDPNVEALAEPGMGLCETRERQTRAPVSLTPTGMQKTDGGLTVLGAGGTQATTRAWAGRLEKHEAHGSATDDGRGGGLKILCVAIDVCTSK